MAGNGYISDAEAEAAIAQPLRLPHNLALMLRRSLFHRGGAACADHRIWRGHALRWAVVRTTIDPFLQSAARVALQQGLEALDRRQDGVVRLPTLQLMPMWKRIGGRTGKDAARHFAAFVTEVDRKRAQIFVNGQNASIPFAWLSGPILRVMIRGCAPHH